MGSSESKKSRNDDYREIYRVNAKDTSAMKKVWRIVEYDLSYYGSIFSTIFFNNHPRYIKYFYEDDIPEFVQDARIKKKFSAVCTIVSALFIDYSKKRQQRDHLLGYIAMIHKDMKLSSQDFENFMLDLLEMLIQELPEEMTAECTIVHMRYFSGLLPTIGYFMQLHREKDSELLERYQEPSNSKKLCCWLSLCDPPLIYGRPPEHWIMKKQYWQERMAFWSSVDIELSGMDSFLSTAKNIQSTKLKKRLSGVAFSGHETNPWLKPVNYFQAAATSSESVSDDDSHKFIENAALSKNIENSRSREISLYESRKKILKQARSNSISLRSLRRPMETIPEVHRSRGFSAAKNGTKNSQFFVDIEKALRDTKIHGKINKIEDFVSESTVRVKSSIIDTGRARKRRRAKRNNVVHPADYKNYGDWGDSSTMQLMLQSVDLGSSIVNQAGKFAEVLAMRNESSKNIQKS